MSARQLIAAFLSILLLAGGPSVGAVSGQSDHAGMVATETVGCGGLGHESASESDHDVAVDCNEPKQSQCRISAAPQCSFVLVFGPVAGSLRAPVQLPGQFIAIPARTAYQNPIPEVLTPPPDLLS